MAVHVRSDHRNFVFVFLMSTLLESQEGNIRNFQRREHSLIKPYHGSGLGIPHWDFVGSTMVTNSYIRLTSDMKSKAGAIWNNVPCHAAAWEVHIQFKVHGSGKALFGDGFAIWYTKERMKPGPVFGSSDLFTGLAIFLDTYTNHNGPHHRVHPYISAMVNNGNLRYDHDTDGTQTQLAGCESQFRNLDYETFVAVRYEAETVTVSTDISNKNAWKECFSVTNIKLPAGYYFGLSAATGDLSDNHDIISIKMYELYSEEAKLSAPSQDIKSPETSSAGAVQDDENDATNNIQINSASGKFLVVIFFLIGIGSCIMAAIFVVQKQQENSRKRFY